MVGITNVNKILAMLGLEHRYDFIEANHGHKQKRINFVKNSILRQFSLATTFVPSFKLYHDIPTYSYCGK